MKKIETLKQVEVLIDNTYIYAAIVAAAAIVLAFLIANMIKYQGGKYNTDHIKRRVWFIVLGVVATIAFFLYNNLYVSRHITKAPLQAKFETANLIATGEVLGVFAVVGIITMLLMRSSKWGSILGKSKK
jgi:hypothetical protein